MYEPASYEDWPEVQMNVKPLGCGVNVVVPAMLAREFASRNQNTSSSVLCHWWWRYPIGPPANGHDLRNIPRVSPAAMENCLNQSGEIFGT